MRLERTLLLLVGLLALLPAACFESGPLGADAGTIPELPGFELPTVDGGVDVPLEDLVTVDTADPDQGPPADAVLCTDDAVCAGLSTDLCLGEQKCISGYCQFDAAAAVDCPPDGNDCTESTCNPATGLCETSVKDDPACICQPIASMPCGGFQQISTADLGETNVLANYTCGPEGGDDGEHAWLFTTDTTQIVSVSADASDSGGVWVLGYDGTRCVPEACIAGGEKGVAFEAQAGFDYAVVFEHPPGLPVLVGMGITCGVQNEFDCDNDVDDDLNGVTDCSDPFCADKPACAGVPESECDDEVDNDADGLTDCVDGDCADAPACDQSCDAVTFVSCGNTFGVNTAGSQSNATNYSCGPEAPGNEAGFIIGSQVTGNVTITLNSGVPQRMYVLEDIGAGCTPFHCVTYGETMVNFDKPPNTTWYIVVDADEGVAGDFLIDVQCN